MVMKNRLSCVFMKDGKVTAAKSVNLRVLCAAFLKVGAELFLSKTEKFSHSHFFSDCFYSWTKMSRHCQLLHGGFSNEKNDIHAKLYESYEHQEKE